MYSIHDISIWQLIRSKMLNIFRPSYRKALMKGPSGSKAGIFGGDNMVLDKISKHKKVKAAKAKAKPAKMVAITETKAAEGSTLAMKGEP